MMWLKNSLIVGLVASVIGGGAGWFVNGWRLEAKFGRAQVAAIEEYEAINKQRREVWEAQTKRDQASRIVLADKLRDSRATADDLRDQIAAADLVAPAPSANTLSECPTHEEVQTVLDNHNFFTADFVSLWNSSSRGTSARPHSTIETD